MSFRSHGSTRTVFAFGLLGAAAIGLWSLARERPEPAAPEPVTNAPVPLVVERHRVLPGSSPAAARANSPPAAGVPSWVELNNEATNDLARGDLALAVDKLERCREGSPENGVFTGNLVEALVRLARLEHERGQLESAVEHLARAIELGTEREDLAVLQRILARWRSELELGRDDWTEGSNRFELTYDTDREDILHHSHEILEHLEMCYDDLVRWFGSDPLVGGAAIRVVLYGPEDFDRLTGLGDWAAGVFDGVVRVSVHDLAGGQDWRAVLRHELVHAFVQGLARHDVPGWLNEGLAQILENRPGEVARAQRLLSKEELVPLERLVGSLAGWNDSAAIARAYAQSLLFVDYLRQTYGDEALRRLLLGLGLGRTPEDAFLEWTSVSLAVAFEDWRDSAWR